MTNKPEMIDVESFVKEQTASIDVAQALITENQDLKAFFHSLRPMLEALENALGYKEGDDINSWDLAFKGAEWIKKAGAALEQIKNNPYATTKE